MGDTDPEIRLIDELVDRVFPPSRHIAVEHVEGGVSTRVYRVRRGDEVFYLRVLPEPEVGFAPEVRVHQLLRARGVRAPEVIYFEDYNEALQRSVMITTEIKGGPLHRGLERETVRRVLNAAGRDLALINDVEIDGFGWIRRDQPIAARLEGTTASNRAFMLEDVDEHLSTLAGNGFSAREVASIREIIKRYGGWLDIEFGRLAHGDFDVTHIYQQGGVYSGIIDFGEIRGADRLYDLGHFALHDGETIPASLLPDLLDGYRSIETLSPKDEQRIWFLSLLIGIRFLARLLTKAPAGKRSVHPSIVAALRRSVAILSGGSRS